MLTALLFPGQGSQTADMASTCDANEPELAGLVRSETGADPFTLADEGTAYAQPAIYCAALALWTGAGRPAADVMAGHSLGELTALVAAGAIAPTDGARLAVERGRLMQAAAERSPGGMVALLGDAAVAREVAAGLGPRIANDNGPTQLVAAGPADSIAAAPGAAKRAGIRAIELPVRGAFHTPAIEPAVEPYREALEAVEVHEPSVPVYSSSTAAPFGPGAQAIRDQLAAALVRPVRWRETMEAMAADGVGRFLEAGPGKALTGMIKRSLDGVEASVLRAPEAAGV